jgi:hypothetical protein
MKKLVIVASLLVFVSSMAHAKTPSLEEMWAIVQSQAAEIDSLKSELNVASENAEQTRVIVDAAADAIDEQYAPTSAIASSWAEKSRFGGYGELLYNSGTQTSDDATNKPSKEIDVQRFVTYFAHEFDDNLRFFSELEVEHSNTGGAGEVELEQAYIEWNFSQKHSVLAGLHLVPVGLLNETHEPGTFYGVERNQIESRIIPTTYRVNGVKFAGSIADGLSYDFSVHEGLQLANNFSVRSSRQGGSRANAEALASTLRVRYNGVPGLELGASLQYQSDLVQDGVGNSRLGRDPFTANGSVDGLLTEAHLAYRAEQGFGLRALYARWDIDDQIEVLGGVGRDEQTGWYVEPSWRFNDKIGIFARREFVDETAGDNDNSSEKNRSLFGINYWLFPTVVVKADIQFESDEGNNAELDGFNLGAGWSF